MEMFIHQDKYTESPEENGSPSMITRENIFQSRVVWKTSLFTLCSTRHFQSVITHACWAQMNLSQQNHREPSLTSLGKKGKSTCCLKPDFYQIQAQNSLWPRPDTQIGECLSTGEADSAVSIHEDHSGIFSWLLINYFSEEVVKLFLSSLMQLAAIFQCS